ncbi:MAG: DUF2064 domain-containing protein [Ginsengibacter sp.]
MNKTAILIFCRSAKKESGCKKLHANAKINQGLHLALYNKTIKVAQESGFPYFLVDENLQTGNNFGEKISNAIASVFQKKFENIIVAGSDCPQLSAGILLNAADKLNDAPMVAGPDVKGGIYLLGISRSVFDPKAFSEIPWQTNKVCKALLQYCTSFSNNFFLIEKLNDLNTQADFYFLKSIRKATHQFIHLIVSIITGGKNITPSVLYSINSLRFSNTKQFRAPPVFF